VIAADPAQPYSQAVVVDTAEVLDAENGTLRMPLGGLNPTTASARVDLVTWEGDADLAGDRVTLSGAALTPEGGGKDPRNPFDGSAAGAVGAPMTFGVDVDSFHPVLGRGAVLGVSTRRDVLLVGAAVVSVPARS
jgi:hypothetical protein